MPKCWSFIHPPFVPITVAILLMGLMPKFGQAGVHHHSGAPLIADESNIPDHDDALNARARGDILSLDLILQLLKLKPNDRLVDVVINRVDARWIYEVTVLTKLGRYRVFTIDAKDGLVLKDETK